MPTYRRGKLLRRAIGSLVAQDFADWVCEVHNDDPSDETPAEILREINDPRVELKRHPRRLGALATFNLFYKPANETYFSILEDDNKWEPNFLSTMTRALDCHPLVSMAWCNQRIMEEMADGNWRDTKSLVNNDTGPSRQHMLIEFGDDRQIMGFVHANGAMLFRSAKATHMQTPDNLPFAAIEPFRERLMPYPILYVPRPLAWYSVTTRTARSKSVSEWVEVQTIMATTFLQNCSLDLGYLKGVFQSARASKPPATNALILSIVMGKTCRTLLGLTQPIDWMRLARTCLFHPSVVVALSKSRREHQDWWRILDEATRKRFREKSGTAANE